MNSKKEALIAQAETPQQEVQRIAVLLVDLWDRGVAVPSEEVACRLLALIQITYGG